MKFLFLLVTIFLSANSFSQNNYYEFEDLGSINLSSFESPMRNTFRLTFSDPDIQIIDIRKSFEEYNPLELIIGSNFDRYVINIIINDFHEVKCDLLQVLDDQRFKVFSCISDTARLLPQGSIKYEHLDSSL